MVSPCHPLAEVVGRENETAASRFEERGFSENLPWEDYDGGPSVGERCIISGWV